MALTEDEARTKWCPFVRITAENDHWKTMTNREQPLNASLPSLLPDTESPTSAVPPPTPPPSIKTNCIASACMCWQWAEKPNPDWKPTPLQSWPSFDDHRNDPPMYIEDKTKGQCGLVK